MRPVRLASPHLCLMAVTCAAGLAPSGARAGQLHIEHYGLREVHARGGTVLVGAVVAAAGSGSERSVTITVTRAFVGNAPADPVPTAGSQVVRPLYAGVEWTDPRVSPIDQRLRGGLSEVPKPGERVVVVPALRGRFELASATAERLRALEVLYAQDQRAALASSSLDRVKADLRDPDLAALARDELSRRGALTAAVLLRADPGFVDAHFRGLDPVARATFIEEVLPATRADRGLRKVAVRIALGSLRPPAVAATARLVAQLDVRDAEEARAFEDTRVALMTLVEQVPDSDLSPFADHLAETTIRRPDYRDRDDWLPKLTARCDRVSRARVAARLLGAVYSSSRARPGEADAFILETAVELARAAPSDALWAPLAKLDPSHPRVTSSKERILAAMVEVGVALARHDAAYRDRVRDLIEPHLDQRLRVPPELEVAYRETIGALPAAAAAPIILELRPRQLGRLPSGERVSIRREADAVWVEIATPGGGSEERSIPASGDMYREWWVPPYVVIVKRAGAGLNLRFTPAAEDPAIEPAEAYDVAKQICDRRGATGDVEQDPREYDGVYVYQAKGAPKLCRVRVGMRTRKVLP